LSKIEQAKMKKR